MNRATRREFRPTASGADARVRLGVRDGVGSMSNDSFASVWDAIEDTPAEAENMKLRSALMMALGEHIQSQSWTQAEAARRLSVTQPRVSDLLRGKIHLFGLDTW